jgi:hypothetical protein
VCRIAVFSSSQFPASTRVGWPEHSGIAAAAMTTAMDPAFFREPNGSCKQHFVAGKINLT